MGYDREKVRKDMEEDIVRLNEIKRKRNGKDGPFTRAFFHLLKHPEDDLSEEEFMRKNHFDSRM